jgi:hypothetical protein
MRDVWAFRFLVLFVFLSFDFLVTWSAVSVPAEEGNLLARAFMILFGTHLGLALFGLFVAVLLLAILCFSRLLFLGKSKWTLVLGGFILDACLGWFIAGVHFAGGTSWFWLAPELTRQSLGAGIYLLLSQLFLVKSCGAYQRTNLSLERNLPDPFPCDKHE